LRVHLSESRGEHHGDTHTPLSQTVNRLRHGGSGQAHEGEIDAFRKGIDVLDCGASENGLARGIHGMHGPGIPALQHILEQTMPELAGLTGDAEDGDRARGEDLFEKARVGRGRRRRAGVQG
jgi:hypothetical protein